MSPGAALWMGLTALADVPAGIAIDALPVARWPAAAIRWDWPVVGTISSLYGPRWGRQHEGIDLAAALGTPVRAAGSGTVTQVGVHGGYGLRIVLSHPGGWTSVYGHLSAVDVTVGDVVGGGDGIGAIGDSGNATGPHLHLELRQGDRGIDPLEVLP